MTCGTFRHKASTLPSSSHRHARGVSLEKLHRSTIGTRPSHPPLAQTDYAGPHTLVRVDLSTAPAGSQTGPAAASGKKKGGRQTGLGNFFSTTSKCLGCKRALSAPKNRPAGIPQSVEAPGLCDSCAQTFGRRAEVHFQYLGHYNQLESQLAKAHAYCARCHSGGLSGRVACTNGECPMLYARLETDARLSTVEQALARLEW